MSPVRLLDEINRLFNEMIHTPWARPTAPAPPGRVDKTFLEVEMPLGVERRGDVSVAIEGTRLIVTLRRRTTGGAGGVAHTEQEQVERTFTLPDNAAVSVIETHFENDVLRVRVGLREHTR